MNQQICKRCVMDKSALVIVFDDDGNCNYCKEFLSSRGSPFSLNVLEKKKRLNNTIATLKHSGRNKEYDCIVGISGGLDSSWVLVKAVELGLRPLAVHMDNGWNSELAAHNIHNLVTKLNVDLYTHVLDWLEYKDLMQAFFDSNVIDVEILYDHAMLAVNYQIATKHRIKSILFGSNSSTEGVKMPSSWVWLKNDAYHIRSIARIFRKKLNTYPLMGSLDFVSKRLFEGIRPIAILDLLEYNKDTALSCLENNYGYKRYPYKHYESVFTRFYQGYILPNKFNVDKRRVHFSSLILTGQMTREEALVDLARIPYASQEDLFNDTNYFLEKMKWSADQLRSYIETPGVSHDVYPSEQRLFNKIIALRNLYRFSTYN
jgi:N-acetyl sugar amidotransferase